MNIPLKSKSNFRHLVHSRSFLIAHHYMRHEKHYFGHISLEWVNVWSCSTLFIMKTSHKSDELKIKKRGVHKSGTMHDIAEILLKVALNTITLTSDIFCFVLSTRFIDIRSILIDNSSLQIKFLSLNLYNSQLRIPNWTNEIT